MSLTLTLSRRRERGALTLPSLASGRGSWRELHTPSMTTRSLFEVRWRSSMSGRYSGELYHALSRAMSGNSRITTRFGVHSPSSTSVAPPRVRYRPPYAAIVAHGLAVFLESGRIRDFNIDQQVRCHSDPPRSSRDPSPYPLPRGRGRGGRALSSVVFIRSSTTRSARQSSSL